MYMRSTFEVFLKKLEAKKMSYEAHNSEFQKQITAAIEVKLNQHFADVVAPNQQQKDALMKLVCWLLKYFQLILLQSEWFAARSVSKFISYIRKKTVDKMEINGHTKTREYWVAKYKQPKMKRNVRGKFPILENSRDWLNMDAETYERFKKAFDAELWNSIFSPSTRQTTTIDFDATIAAAEMAEDEVPATPEN